MVSSRWTDGQRGADLKETDRESGSERIVCLPLYIEGIKKGREG